LGGRYFIFSPPTQGTCLRRSASPLQTGPPAKQQEADFNKPVALANAQALDLCAAEIDFFAWLGTDKDHQTA